MPTMDLAAVVASLSIPGTITVKRLLPGTYGAGGRWVDGGFDLLTLTASVQPTPGEALLLLPEALRTKESLAIWTQVELYATDVLTQTKGDQVLYEGKTFEVQLVQDYSRNGNYWQSVIVKVGQSGPSGG